jgi:hypothetical protein
MLTQSELKALLDYNPDTGIFTRLVSRSNNCKVGPCKEHKHPYGYVQIGLGKKMYLAHRLAFLWMTGAWPSKNIDHINGVFDDNRWQNLRQLEHFENLQNVAGAASNNKLTGLLGVKVDRRRGTFVGRLTLHGKEYRTKSFKTPEEAHAARNELARTLHPYFNPNRGN